MSVVIKQLLCQSLFATINILFLCQTQLGCLAAEKAVIKGQVSSNVVIDVLDMTGVACAQKPSGALQVIDVRLGRAAYNAGVQKDDVIRSFQATAQGYNILIERGGQQYQLAVRSAPAVGALQGTAANTNLLVSAGAANLKSALSPKADSSLHKLNAVDKTKILRVTASQQQEDKKILLYNIEFVIDISGSMQASDGTDGLSKFDWCREQVSSLADRLEPYARSVDITVFNDRYQTAESCNRDAIAAIYSGIRPGGGTSLAAPLIDRCEKALAKRQAGGRPTLIAVITDGLPHDQQAVYQNLMAFTQKMTRSDDVIITFLQIGENFNGQEFCLALDNNLVANGAKFDIVDTRTFDQLRSETMPRALVHALLNVDKKSDHAGKR